MPQRKTRKPDANLADHRLWMRQPAAKWDDGFLLGNGRLGAIWSGGIDQDRIVLNHENLWRAADKHLSTPVCHQHLAEIREAFFRRDWVRGHELCTRYLSGPEIHEGALDRIQPYQVFGQLDVTFPAMGEVREYCRQLHLGEAAARTHFLAGRVRHDREMFVSRPHQAIVLRLRATDGPLRCRLALTREPDGDCTLSPWSKGNRFGFTGRFREGIEFAAEGRVFSDGRARKASAGALDVTGASDVLVLLTMAVDYSEPAPAECCRRRLDECPTDYDVLLAAHVAEYAPAYERCALELNSPPTAGELPTDARLEGLRRGAADPGLFALMFHFGRYLLLSCSRGCEQPANLQGIWNPHLRPPWESDFHVDVNLEMNYWSAEPCNLPECVEPLLAFLERHEPLARESARNYYDCRGIHMGTGDIWQMSRYLAAGCDVLPTCAAWLAEHFWWRYEFSDDAEFLRSRAYPFLKGVAEFFEDFLVPDPRTGYLVTVPSQSPENTFAGVPSPAYCLAPTFDVALAREVLERCLKASEILGLDSSLRPVWRGILKKLPPFQIGRHGQLQEWLEDMDESDPGHRHVSHLVGVFPGELMGPRRGARFSRAARVSLERRIQAGGGSTEWSQVWRCGLFARWLDGDRALEQLRILLADLCTPGLLAQHPGPVFQIDGNLGAPGVIAEMLLQSHDDVIRLLPALPAAWAAGKVRGLRARHAVSADIEWRGGTLTQTRLVADRTGPVRVAYRKKTIMLELKRGQARIVRARELAGI